MGFNNKREVFPSNLIAGVFNFQAAALLEITEADAHNARSAEGAVLFVIAQARPGVPGARFAPCRRIRHSPPVAPPLVATMNFFERQEAARKTSRRLLVCCSRWR
jgi:hypothetical protein